MQIFVRDLSGNTLSFNASTPLELVGQVMSTTGLSPASARLSYNSRSIPPSSSSSSSSSFDDFGIQNHATLDLSLRLRGGGPKKRCAYVYAKTGTTPSTSGSATPSGAASATASTSATPASTAAPAEAAPATAPATAAANDDAKMQDGQDGAANADSATMASTTQAAVPEPAMERCNSAALRMVGECPRCTKNFCAAHRLPEDHACPALANFRKAAFDENRERLVKEATHTSKISAF